MPNDCIPHAFKNFLKCKDAAAARIKENKKPLEVGHNAQCLIFQIYMHVHL